MRGYTLSIDDGIAHLILNRPEASNALGANFWNSLPGDIWELDKSGEVTSLVISAEGKNFCSGMDLSEFSTGIPETNTPEEREAFYHLALSLQETFTCLERTRFPVISSIQGACVGAGLELAAACDIRFATHDCFFRIEEINTGIMADVGALQRLPKILPEPVVKEMAFLGTPLPAERASHFGLVSDTLSSTPEEALKQALKAAKIIGQKAPVAIAGSKSALHWARDHSISDSLEWSARTQSSLWSKHDIMASIASRMHKTPAKYSQLGKKKLLGET
ncbi:enoyl-CoA hydratase-related protein [Hirschia baltica]|uniref:Enoyl-CoA hydratase/isomerase n=1 Tax=Hirschia baltica (strain ATCC 49814 / DSM 5838 / IFAM 1418) TaxID=582402 RepID=C6XNX6_HIRBI|nr:enoyl-CoA hydratase-related protein [Hirschia baltica]ACT60156.1 Enoyl-CoA hydratase/isomerase [Hirschia baltica ATCC 49814]